MLLHAAGAEEGRHLFDHGRVAAEHDVNVGGVANVIRHFVPPMVSAGRGVIVNLSSGWGRSVAANVAPYCCTKWAIEGLTRALAEELPQGLAAIPLYAAGGLLAMYAVTASDSTTATLLDLPLALQEMVLAVWMLARGFRPASGQTTSRRPESTPLRAAARERAEPSPHRAVSKT